MVDIVHKVGIKAPLAQVYAAVATTEGVAGWWSQETSGASEPGGSLKVGFSKPDGEVLGAMGMTVTAMEPERLVRWRFDAGPDEWIGTDAVFDLSRDGDYTIVLFRHENWREQVEFTAHCSTKWATFMLSLKDFVETGTGRPSPHDLKIDNWN